MDIYCICLCLCVCVCVYVCTYMYIFMHMYMYIHVYIIKYIYSSVFRIYMENGTNENGNFVCWLLTETENGSLFSLLG